MPSKISVIIPVYNDPEGLKDTLESLIDQDYDGEYEILPVDNNSTDDTGKVIKDFEEKYPDLVRGLEEKEVQSSYAARNKGIEESTGDILCFIDADMWANQDYLSKIYNFFEDNPSISYIGCNVETVRESSNPAALYNEINSFPIKRYIKELNFSPTCCLSVKKEIFKKTGLFNKKLVSGGDREFGIRVNNSGFEMSYLDEVTMYHPARSSWKSLKDKSFRIGRGAFQKQIECPEKFEHQRTPLYDLKQLMPTTPSRLASSTEVWDELSNYEKTSFFMIYWINKVSQYLGYQYERFIVQNYILHP